MIYTITERQLRARERCTVIRAIIEEAVAFVSLALFVGTIAVWAIIIATS